MDGVVEVLRNLQLLVFLGAVVAALRIWWLSRSRPAALLAVTFATLGGTLLLSRSLPESGDATVEVLRDVVLVGLLAFPWLLALFAWSFESRFPRWLLAAGVAVAGLSVWALLLPPLADASPAARRAFLVVFVGVWVLFGLTAAGRLWRAGGSQPLVRARMRLMAVGAIALTLAILVAGFGAGGGTVAALPVVTNGLAIVSALMFVAAFAPPRALRMWWRRRITRQWQDMQSRLIAAATPREAAAAVVPMVANTVGGGTVIVDADGEVLAHAGVDEQDAATIAGRIKTGEEPAPGDEVVAVDRSFLVVRSTSYTPVFGQDERDILAGFAMQLRLAFERAELFEDNVRGRRELERANRDLHEVMVGLAHDLRNPCVAIDGYGSLLLGADTDEERAELLAGITTSTTYLNQLVDSLMELSRVGRTPDELRPVDLNQTIQAVQERLHGVHPDVHIVAGQLPTIEANPVAMQQVFENLLFNAAKHGGRPDLTVTITTRQLSDGTAIDVVDDGHGIDPDDRDVIFTPFRRGHGAALGGSGVGLGLVRRVIEAHGGTIDLLDSEAGAHFRILLPT